MKVTGYGNPQRTLNDSEIESIIASGLTSLPLSGKRVLVIIPDQTRTMPLPLFFRLITRALSGVVAQLDFLVALGTHPPLDERALLQLVGLTKEQKDKRYADIKLLNHAWKNPQALATLGEISAEEVARVSSGLLKQRIPVRLNRLALDYDQLLVCGPVFPHEVVGFSGGNKYFFPGIAGQEIIDITHWLGALITSYAMIGAKDTPVRQIINQAAAMIPTPRHALCAVVTHEGVNGLFVGSMEEAYGAAADLSAQVHIRWVDNPYQKVLSVLPKMYDEIWTGAKGMYKLEPVVADGGEVIIYAPHIRNFSMVHGAIINKIGYHVRDYFTAQWDRFKHYPWGVLAHSTHLRGIGRYKEGVEDPRIQVTLATGIPEEACRQVNLGYRNPDSINLVEWETAPSEGALYVPRAGEYLYRVKS